MNLKALVFPKDNFVLVMSNVPAVTATALASTVTKNFLRELIFSKSNLVKCHQN